LIAGTTGRYDFRIQRTALDHALGCAHFSRGVDGCRTRGAGAFARLVRVDHPFHHPLMHPASEALKPRLPIWNRKPKQFRFQHVTGGRLSGETCDAEYWGRGIRDRCVSRQR
jgi:acyl transferase domain-containing protein